MLQEVITALIGVTCLPGVLFTAPYSGLLKWAIHVGIFILAYKLATMLFPMLEGFSNPDTRRDVPCPAGFVKCPLGDCKRQGDKYGGCA